MGFNHRAATLFVTALGLILAVRPSAGRVVVISDFEGTAIAERIPWRETSGIGAEVEFGGWRLGSGTRGVVTRDDELGFSVCAGSISRSTLEEAILAGQYLSFSIAAASGELDLRQARFELGWSRHSGFAPNRLAVFTDRGGFAAGQEVYTSPVQSSAVGPRVDVFHLPADLAAPEGGVVEVRVVLFAALYCNHEAALTAFRLDNGLRYVLTTGTEGEGVVASTPVGHEHAPETEVVVGATALPGHSFVGWEGDARGAGNPVVVRMDRSRTIRALFRPEPDGLLPGGSFEADFGGSNAALETPWTRMRWQHPQVEWSGLSGGAGIRPTTSTDAFRFSVDAGSSGTRSTLADARRDAAYLAFTLQPQTGGPPLDLAGDKIRFAVQRDSGFAPTRFAVFTSVDGFAAGQELFLTEALETDDLTRHEWAAIVPPEARFRNLSGPVEVRIYAFGAAYASHYVRLLDLAVLATRGLVSLTFAADGPGRIEVVPSGPLVEEGQMLVATAKAEPGARFAGWGGSAAGPGTPLHFAAVHDTHIVARFASRGAPAMTVGMNLGAVSDWGHDWHYTDLWRNARTWMSRNADFSGPWDSGQGGKAPVNADGWPIEVPFDPGTGAPPQMLHSIVTVPKAGAYTFRYRGSGRFSVRMDQRVGAQYRVVVANGPESSVHFSTDAARASFLTEIYETDPNDPLRDFSLESPDFDPASPVFPFHPRNLERLSPFGVLRAMNWQRTNGSPMASWNERTTPTSYTQAREEGAALEHAARLASLLGQDLWICVPHKADDDWVREAARLVDAELAPGLAIYLEYSNETWNYLFSQTTWVQDRGEALRLAPDRWGAGQRYAALRSAEVWKLFAEELSPQRDLVKVLATMAVSPWLTEYRLGTLLDPQHNPARILPDAIAIAPYFTHNFTSDEVAAFRAGGYPSVDDLIEVDMPAAIDDARSGVRSHRELADRHGMRLVAYEGGQHYVGVYEAVNDQPLTDLLIAANRDPRMYDRYTEYLDMLATEGIDLFANWLWVGVYSKYGSWAVLEEMETPLADAAKLRALLDWMAANPAPWGGSVPRDGDLDGVDDAVDLCPGMRDPGQVDGDDDGLGDACDPCTDPLPTAPDRPVAKLKRRHVRGLTHTHLSVRVLLPEGENVAPLQEGLSVALADGGAGFDWSAALPAGVAWQERRPGSSWRYSDAAGSVGGVTRADVRAFRRSGEPIGVRVDIRFVQPEKVMAATLPPWTARVGLGGAAERRTRCDEVRLATCRIADTVVRCGP